MAENWYAVCSTSDVAPGATLIVEVDGREIVVANVDGEYLAIRNTCPHQGAPLGCGRLGGTMLPSDPGEFWFGREGEILRCPWHGFEFDMRTGRSLHDPKRMRVRSYRARVNADQVELAIS